jgi:hypothetical protein
MLSILRLFDYLYDYKVNSNMQDTQRPFDTGNSSYLPIQNPSPLSSSPRIRDLYILPSPYSLTSKTSENDSTITTKIIPSNTTPVFQSKAITSRRERKKQSQITKMTSYLTPASTITARLWHRRLAHHNNGVAERMIRTITEMAKAMILDSQVPLEFWGDAVNMAAYLHQRMPNEGLARACMMVSYLHDSTTLRRISDLEHNTVKAQSDVIFYKGVHDDGSDEAEETTEINIFGLPQEENT